MNSMLHCNALNSVPVLSGGINARSIHAARTNNLQSSVPRISPFVALRSSACNHKRSRKPAQFRASDQSEVSSSGRASATVPAIKVPRSPQETVQQATAAVQRAWSDGIKRQKIQYLLPLIGATDLDDWPGGIRQQFKAAAPMLEDVLVALKQAPELSGKLSPQMIDDGDAVAAWTGDKLAAVLFPTAETLKQVRDIAEKRTWGLVLLVNPQWQGGQVVSDFGIGPWRQRNEEFVASFTETYMFKQLRMLGEDVRILYSYPGQWQVHVVEDNGEPALVSTSDTLLSYSEMETLLRGRPGSKASMTWAQRIQREIDFNMNSMK